MGVWPSLKASVLERAIVREGFALARTNGSHRRYRHTDGRAFTYSFHGSEEVGHRMVSKVCADAGITPERLAELL